METFRNPLGNITLSTYTVPASVLEKLTPNPVVEKGLEGFYRHSPDGKETPFLKRWDPLLDFSFRDLPMTGTPLFIHWTGQFKAPQAGHYHLRVMMVAAASGRIRVDQKEKTGYTNNPYWEGSLEHFGWHQFDFDYQDSGSPVTRVELLWMPPGAHHFELMPNSVFGRIK